MATIKIKTTMVTPSDIKGDITDFPIEVVQKMLDEQARQGNRADVTVFQRNNIANKKNKGFEWSESEDGDSFWVNVIVARNFDLFFEKYPKVVNKVYIIGDSNIGIDIIKTLENRGGINRYNLTGKNDDVIYYIDPITSTIHNTAIDSAIYNLVVTTYKCIKADEQKVVISLSEIAKELGVDVNKIVVKV